MAIVDYVDWRKLDKVVQSEQRNREAHAPVVSLFRWWARRPHAVAGSLLDAAVQFFRSETFVVADPFSGGGTVAFEAARRGLRTYAQDLYPWPSFGLATSLAETDETEFKTATNGLLATLRSLRARYQYRRNGRRWETIHVIRVRTVPCPECQNRVYLYREPLITLASRREKEQFGFFGCQACGRASKRRSSIRTFLCDGCHLRWDTGGDQSKDRTAMVCPHCTGSIEVAALMKRPPVFHPVLVHERLVAAGEDMRVLRCVGARERSRYVDVRTGKAGPSGTIEDGMETRHLLQQGFKRWNDLYTERQLEAIDTAVESVRALDVSPAVRNRLMLAVLGSAEMPAFLTRWERYHPKAIEAIANHRFARATVVVETNLLSPVGRGTIPRRLQNAARALTWSNDEGLTTDVHQVSTRSKKRATPIGAAVVNGSSERQLLPDGTVGLVLTDPPYHDDLQYGELARLFHSWMNHALGTALPSETREAVPNTVRGTTSDDYRTAVASCLKESRRTLGPKGRLLLTFHNKDLSAWLALGQSLRRARLRVVGLATVSAENSADHSKRGKSVFLSDLVVECIRQRRPAQRKNRVVIRGRRKGAERANLIAVGRAVAEVANGALPDGFGDTYVRYLRSEGVTTRLIH